jgi:hypothetical protein
MVVAAIFQRRGHTDDLGLEAPEKHRERALIVRIAREVGVHVNAPTHAPNGRRPPPHAAGTVPPRALGRLSGRCCRIGVVLRVMVMPAVVAGREVEELP